MAVVSPEAARRMSTPYRDARIARLDPAAREQTILSLEHDAVLEARHVRPGQFCQLRLGEATGDGHFVLIDPPGSGPLRFLLRAGGPVADALRAVEAGSHLSMRGPTGNGFPIEQANGRDVLLVSAGSGLAAIRPVLLSLHSFGARRVWLYHGARTLEHVPFLDDLQRAERDGLRLTLTLSQEGNRLGDRVQNAIVRDAPDLSHAVAFVSGMQALIDALRVDLPRLGLPADAIHLNY